MPPRDSLRDGEDLVVGRDDAEAVADAQTPHDDEVEPQSPAKRMENLQFERSLLTSRHFSKMCLEPFQDDCVQRELCTRDRSTDIQTDREREEETEETKGGKDSFKDK